MATGAERLQGYWAERRFDRERLVGLAVRHWEIGLYAVLIALALSLRLWDLGSRALHHDESLHAFYSWELYKGRGYEHVPFMHGPFQYFGTALTFILFGASDYTSRVWPVLFGTALVGLPFFLRGYLGRTGALIAAALLALSPTLLYFSRFARNDIYIAFFTLALIVCIWRYLAERRDLYLYLAAGLLALSFATKEVTFITVAIFLLYLDLLVTYDLVGQLRQTQKLDAWGTALAYAVVLPLAWLFVALWPLLGELRKRFSIRDEFPAAGALLVLIGTLTLPQFAAGVQKLPFVEDKGPVVPEEETLRNVSVTFCLIAAAYVGLIWRARVWLIAAGIFYAIFVLLYTSFFTNMGGFWTGIWGSLDYWLSQQHVQRGDQPDYYYFVLLPVYEFLPLIFALGGALWYAFRGSLLYKAIAVAALALVLILTFVGDDLPLIGSYHIQVRFVIVIGAMLLLPLERFTQFLLFWMLAILFGLTVAGEKMPWLHVHLALPVAILAAKVLHDLLTRVDLKLEGLELPPLERWAPSGYAALAAALAVVVFIVAGPASVGSVGGWALALVALGTVVWVARSQSGQAALQVGAVALACALGVFTLRAGILASWGHPNLPQLEGRLATEDHGDTPVEMLVYTQSSPDIPVLRDEIDRLATASGRGRDLPIEVDSSLTWPWPWYLRDYRSVGYPVFSEDYQPPTGTVLLVEKANVDHLNLSPDSFSEGVPFTLRWWFPEHGTYRDLAVKDFFADLFDPGTWDAWRGYFIDRELEPGLGTMDAVAYFPQGFEVSRPPPPAEVETVWVEDGQLVIGGPGAAAGQLSQPAGMAVDAQGNLYVADSLNHRIQKYGPDGHYLAATGDLGAAEGQFSEPWSVAVDAQGNIYVADTWNHRIQKFDSDLNFVTAWGQPATDLANPGPYDLFGPRGITIDAEGDLLVTDTGNKRVLKFSPDGEHLATYGKGGSGPGEFEEPVGIAVGPGGDIYVADTWNQRIQRFDADFNYLGEIEVESWGSQGVTDKPYIVVLSDGRVLATDPANAGVLVFSAKGELLATWELPGGRPVGIALTADGQVYVSDGAASEVRRVPLETLLGE